MSDVSAAVARGRGVLDAQRFRVQERRLASLPPSCCPCCGQAAYFGKVTVSLDLNSISFRDKTVFLTRTLTEMAYVLATSMPRVVRRDFLFERIWGTFSDTQRNSADVHFQRLRDSIKPLGLVIETVRGVGWLMKIGDSDARS